MVRYDDKGCINMIIDPSRICFDDRSVGQEISNRLRPPLIDINDSGHFDAIEYIAESGGVGLGHSSASDYSDSHLAHVGSFEVCAKGETDSW